MKKNKIKFRAWNKLLNKFIDPSFSIVRGTPVLEKELEIMQFTGLHDNNGTPIYESDIVKLYETTKIKIVKWVESETLCGWNIRKGSSLEVIGNIYESPPNQ